MHALNSGKIRYYSWLWIRGVGSNKKSGGGGGGGGGGGTYRLGPNAPAA